MQIDTDLCYTEIEVLIELIDKEIIELTINLSKINTDNENSVLEDRGFKPHIIYAIGKINKLNNIRNHLKRMI